MDGSALGTVGGGGDLHQLDAVWLAAMGSCRQQRPGHLFVAHTAVRQGTQTKIQSVLAWSPLCSTYRCATGKQTKIQSAQGNRQTYSQYREIDKNTVSTGKQTKIQSAQGNRQKYSQHRETDKNTVSTGK